MSAQINADGWRAQQPAYLIDGRRLDVDSPCFTQAVAEAHRNRQRPQCLCTDPGLPVYVARLVSGYHLKRMPETGHLHHPDCPHHEPTADEAGLGQVMGTAIREDPDTGITTLRLDFALSRTGPRMQAAPTPNSSDTVRGQPNRLSLGGLLRYLWHEAGLTQWRPEFEGKRTWGAVRRRLLNAAEGKMTGSGPLLTMLYIPEPFRVEQREAINARRIAHWGKAKQVAGRPQQLILMIAEVKEIVPARYGHRLVIKHLPDLGFAVDEAMFRRIGRLFELELAMWAADEALHIVIAATLDVSAAGVDSLEEIWLMLLGASWLPIAAPLRSNPANAQTT